MQADSLRSHMQATTTPSGVSTTTGQSCSSDSQTADAQDADPFLSVSSLQDTTDNQVSAHPPFFVSPQLPNEAGTGIFPTMPLMTCNKVAAPQSSFSHTIDSSFIAPSISDSEGKLPISDIHYAFLGPCIP